MLEDTRRLYVSKTHPAGQAGGEKGEGEAGGQAAGTVVAGSKERLRRCGRSVRGPQLWPGESRQA